MESIQSENCNYQCCGVLSEDPWRDVRVAARGVQVAAIGVFHSPSAVARGKSSNSSSH